MIDMTSVVQRDLTRVPTPSGLWLRCGTAGFTAADDDAFRAAPDEARFTLLVGAPGESTPTVAELVEVVGSLPATTRARLVLTVYGAESPDAGFGGGSGAGCLAQRLADALLRPVRAHHGLLLDGPDGLPRRTAVDLDGRPSWQPFAQLSTYRAGQVGATVDRWRAPFPAATAAGPGSYRLTSDWTVDVVPAGLVVRPAAAVPVAALRCAPTDTPPTAHRCRTTCSPPSAGWPTRCPPRLAVACGWWSRSGWRRPHCARCAGPCPRRR